MTLPEPMPDERTDSGVPVPPPDDGELAAACRNRAPAVGTRGRRSRVALAWVTTAEGLQHVSTWAHLPRKQRLRNTKDAPRAVTCPVCRRPVVIRIPRWRAHHAAHAPGDRCPVTRPETALHFNLKCLIAKELETSIGTGHPFRVVETCFVGHWEPGLGFRSSAPPPEGVHRSEWLESTPCRSSRERVWLEAWDRVELEERVGDDRTTARVPDVVLYRGGKAVGAVEVFYSHGVDDAKARVLADLGVPWVEVKASEALIDGAAAWALERPLPAHREGPAQRWRCAAHEEALRCAREDDRRQREAEQRRFEAERRRMAAAREAAREAARHTRRLVAVKLVDLLYPKGTQWRNVYRVVELSTDGTTHTLRLERGGDTLLDLALASAPRRNLVARIEARVAADLRAVEASRGATTDCAMQWAKGPLAERIVGMIEDGAWQQVPLEHTHPVRYHFNRQTGEWFMPADLRDVTWERPDSDPLTEAHPAWARQSGRSREVTGPHNPMPRVAGPSGAPLPSPAPSTPRRPAAALRGALPRGPVAGVDLGPTVAEVVPNEAATVYQLRRTTGRPECVVVVAERRIAPDDARRIDEAFTAAGVERLWLSRSEHWTRVLSDLPWLPLSPGAHNGFVVPSRRGFISPAEAASAFAAGVSEFSEAAVVARRYAQHLPS